jgi:hypothetical protein
LEKSRAHGLKASLYAGNAKQRNSKVYKFEFRNHECMSNYDFISKINTESIESIPIQIQKVIDLIANYNSNDKMISGQIMELNENYARIVSKINGFKISVDITSLMNGHNQDFEYVKNNLSKFLNKN